MPVHAARSRRPFTPRIHSVDVADSEGMTPLMEAARAASGFDVAGALLAASAQADLFSKAGFTPLSMAAGTGKHRPRAPP